MAKLTDKQRKKIIAEHAEGASTRCLARKYHVSDTTIRRTLKSDPETAERVARKKEENVQSVLSHMDARKNDVCAIIDALLEAIRDPQKIADATAVQLATTLGILIDKFTKNEAVVPSGGESNLLELLANCGKEGFNDLPELQSTAADDHAVVEHGTVS